MGARRSARWRRRRPPRPDQAGAPRSGDRPGPHRSVRGGRPRGDDQPAGSLRRGSAAGVVPGLRLGGLHVPAGPGEGREPFRLHGVPAAPRRTPHPPTRPARQGGVMTALTLERRAPVSAAGVVARGAAWAALGVLVLVVPAATDSLTYNAT